MRVVGTVATVDWVAAQKALSEEVARVVALLRSGPDVGAHAVGEWNLGEVAMHLSQGFLVVPGLARRDLSAVHDVLTTLPPRDSGSLIGDVWELGGVTTDGVRSDPERDPRVLADRIEERAAAFLVEAATGAAEERRAWMVEGVEVAMPTLTCHLLNEAIMHGRDMALAAGRRWPIERSHAAMAVDGFLVPVIASLGPRTMVDQKAAAGLRAVYEVGIRGGGRHCFVFDDGALTIEEPSSRRVDCHLSVDPAAFLLVAWGRTSQWGAIARGQLVAWGRRPWLGPRFRALMRNA